MNQSGNGDQRKPPDGGWGWMIVLAYGMANIIIIPVLQSFGLIYKDKFRDMNISATNASLIINLASAVGMTFGLFNGPLLRNFGYRKVAITGGFFFSTGLMMTSGADNFTHFLITYSIIASIGMGLCNSSFSLALNTYFVIRRNKAAGIAMTITGLGPILLPQLVSFLLSLYGPRGCLLIIGGLATHILAAGLLLQPVKWHAIKSFPETTDNENSKEKTGDEQKYSMINSTNSLNNHRWELSSDDEDSYLEQKSCINSISHDIDTQSIYGFELTPQLRKRSFVGVPSLPRCKSEVLTIEQKRSSIQMIESNIHKSHSTPNQKRWFHVESCNTINLGSSLQIFDETQKESMKSAPSLLYIPPPKRRWYDAQSNETINLGSSMKIFENKSSNAPVSIMKKTNLPQVHYEEPETPSAFGKVVKFFDLSLLNDPIYVNMMLGMSIAVFAEINFSILTPFILNDLGYVTEEIAAIMSTLAVADLMFRFISPFVGDFFKMTPRIMYMISLVMLITTRFSILLARNYREMLYVAFCLGVAKGVRSVYMSLVIPSYVPIKRLPSASSIQMMTNGIILMTIGPIVGLIRDVSGSYSKSIIFINAFTIVTLTMWIIEIIYVRHKCNQT